MIPLSETLKKKEYKRKKRKSRAKNTPIERSPQNTPGHYLNYGKGAYVVLCYAFMRSRMVDREWFTASEYIEFQERRFTIKIVSAMCARLNKCGYLTRRPIMRKPVSQKCPPGKTFEYHITELGVLALNRLAQMHKRNLQDDE
jgi:hypothetical protein